MPENWKTYKLGDVCKLRKDSITPEKFNNEAYLGLEHIGQGTFLLDGIGNASDASSNKYKFQSGDILYGKIRPYFKKVYRPDFSGICSTDMLIFISKDEKLASQDFLYHLFKTQEFTDRATETSSGTKMPRADWNSLSQLEYELPPLPEQKAITNILSALDDKIENNLAMNKTLEDMAMALYKHWFVDFGPFQEGNFIDSELGPIPEGWEVKHLDEEYSITIGRTPPRKETHWFSINSGIKWVSIKDMGNSGTYIFNTSEYLTEEAVKKKNVPIIPEGTVILSFKLTIGRVTITTEKMVSNEAIAHLIQNPHTKISNAYSYLYLKCFDYNSLASTSSIATAVNSKTIKAMKIIVPENHVCKSFDKEVFPLFDQIKNNSQEIETLTQLRDTLLPKLISGEVRLKEFEKQVSEVL